MLSLAARMLKTHLLTVLFTLVLVSGVEALTSPEDFLGHRVGADRELARYSRVVDYFTVLGNESARVRFDTVGTSTLGKPITLAVVSTEENMRSLDRYRNLARRLVDPRALGEQEAMKLAAEGKVFLLLLCNQHGSEIASSNMVMELAWDLARAADPEVESALEDVYVMLVPTANPDGQTMIVDHYDRYVGTPYEGGGLPWLYHHYAGHDNNRDWFVLNLAETSALVNVLYGDWFPQVLVDVHQMGSSGVRMFVPPFFDPPNPNNHHLIWNQIELLGTYMKYRLAEAGKQGVINNAYYSGWYQGSIRPNATQHHITALLTENASVNIASPIYIDPSELRGTEKGLPEYGVKMNFTYPWPGGWWRLRDIVEYQLVAFKGIIRACADNREQFLRNFYRMSAETLDREAWGAPYAYLVPPDQHDPGSTSRMLEIFDKTRCEIHRAREAFRTADNRLWPAGTLVLKTAQPYGRFVRDLLEKKPYPDLRKYPGGPPMPPYDNAAWTVSLMMGVDVTEVAEPFEADLELLERSPEPLAEAAGSPALLDCRDNSVFHAVNLLLDGGATIHRCTDSIETGGENYPPGCFVVQAEPGLIQMAADSARVRFAPLAAMPDRESLTLIEPGRIGLYRGWVASMDEGWTRLIMDRFDFNYTRLDNERVGKGNLIRDFSVIILPSLGAKAMVEGHDGESWPPEYRGGFGKEGVEQLKEFVRDGGTLICLRSACDLAVEEFDIPVREVHPGDDFYCPGSLLELHVDSSHPLGYGMPEETACFFSHSTLLATSLPHAGGPGRRVVARYGDSDILLSGWILGESLIHGEPAVVDVSMGKGNVVLCGLAVQNRAQTWGTFKLLFNAIFRGYR